MLHKETNGKIGYVYVYNSNPSSKETIKQGLIWDLRVSQQLIFTVQFSEYHTTINVVNLARI